MNQTANGKYKYDSVYYGKTLNEWIQLSHKNNCQKNGWNFYELKRGMFGYDNMACSLGYLFENMNKKLDEEYFAELIHEGWKINYLYWRDNQPWNNGYLKPNQTLNDERRNKLAMTPHKDLPDDEKEKDLIIARFILSNIKD